MKLLLMVFLIILNIPVYSQINRNGTLTEIIDSVITAMPQTSSTNEYQTPSGSDLTSWGTVIQNLIDGDYSSANSTAGTIGYSVYKLTDTSSTPNKIFYMLLQNTGSLNYWGSFILNPTPDRQKLFIQCPHPIFDTHTGNQGIRIFYNIGARAFITSGTHRCNNSDTTTCAGTSTVCGGTRFRISDQAHTVDGTFQKSTQILATNIPGLIVIQPHGFAKDLGDPDLIMSNGNTKTPTTDYLSTLKTNLESIDNTLTFKIAHIDTAYTNLTATTNTQGRYINGSATPCSHSASLNSGRFLSIEQAYTGLRDNEANWNKLSDALEATFPIDALPVELSSFSASIDKDGVFLFWTTATEINNYGFEIQRYFINSNSISENQSLMYTNQSGWEKIGFVNGYGNSNSIKQYSFIDNSVSATGKYIYRLKQIDNDGQTEFSGISSVEYQGNFDYSLKQNYPNPFNPATIIKYSISEKGFVRLTINDILGRVVKRLVNQEQSAGNYEINFNASDLASGIYFYCMQAGNFAQVKKMILLK